MFWANSTWEKRRNIRNGDFIVLKFRHLLVPAFLVFKTYRNGYGGLPTVGRHQQHIRLFKFLIPKSTISNPILDKSTHSVFYSSGCKSSAISGLNTLQELVYFDLKIYNLYFPILPSNLPILK